MFVKLGEARATESDKVEVFFFNIDEFVEVNLEDGRQLRIYVDGHVEMIDTNPDDYDVDDLDDEGQVTLYAGPIDAMIGMVNA